ncbi:conserved hypothetical protein [Paecilomyces variotii No. 5]|uniref:CHY-type domain-containing protein n=1 Tax=Byssochlamys spectabilis (strain No. 5 / NBRC 109023) TaxID=1356009 RepID=V5HRS5_BYSSN|nr:conserved hypothetical protein [Paecilomyces variotii No. 5]
MCKHILNAQVAIRSPCCRKWFDCAECHYEQESHPLMQSFDMVSICDLPLLVHACYPAGGEKRVPRGEIKKKREEKPYLTVSDQQTFACKKCKKCFRKDASEFEERYVVVKEHILAVAVSDKINSDEYCPHCDNHFVLEAKTPTPALKVEGEDARIDSRFLKDDRVRGTAERSIFNARDAADRLG